MKKLLALTLLTALLLTACGNQASQPASASSDIQPSVEESTEPLPTNETTSDLSELDALGSVEVETEPFDVILTIPKDFVGDSTQNDLNQLCEEKGFESITLNDDGSATYVMTKSQHNALMEEYRTQINSSLQEMVGSEDYPDITAIETNDNFTEFTITTKSAELSTAESLSVIVFYTYSGLYSIFSGETADNITINFVNADTGEIISSSNSSDLEK